MPQHPHLLPNTTTEVLPALGALAAGMGLSLLSSAALAQAAAPVSQTASATEENLPAITVTDKTKRPDAKTSYQATTTTLGKGKQALRDIPQSLTVVTEKLMADRNLDTVKDVLHQTAGITFQAAEGGEEDIRLRGFSLQTTGDIFLDGMRDPAIYDRDTFNLDRLELLRGSASMLFGRGSTGGAVNQVSKAPYLGSSASEVSLTGGNHDYARATGDFNIQTADDAALRITGMRTQANNNGSGSSIDKYGLAASYRWGIGKPLEQQVSLYHLNNDNGINYGLPWIKPRSTDGQSAQTVNSQLDPARYYGMASDYSHTEGDVLTYMNTVKLGGGAEVKSVVRRGEFKRDQRASTIRLTAGEDLSNFNAGTVFTRGTQIKIQDMDVLQAQSDYTGKHELFGLKHDITTGLDMSREKRSVYGAKTSAQGGVTLTKPNTTAGTPDDGAWVDESSRVLGLNNRFTATGAGAYVQDLIHIAPMWKVLGGLRYDFMSGSYTTYNLGTGAQSGKYQQSINKFSKRIGLLFQPNALDSYHFSYGTSFNTSGDTYSYNAQSANTPPESSENIELGAKLDSEDGRVTTRLALFRATKLHERNTDPDNAATQLLLSGKRHAAGFDMDVTGQVTDNWEVYASYTWIPEARVDEAASTATTGGARKGDRPGLTPRHSGTIWNTYKFAPQWRAGVGLNFRSQQAPADISNPANGIYHAPGFGTLDLMAEYAINQTYTVKGNVSNVANKLYADQVYRGHYIPGAGRLVQVTLSAKF
jgi:catecholate siderophore receptor